MNIKTNKPNSAKKILDAATAEFSKKGLAGARVDKIAQKAGVNKAMIYYHFDSKENLYRQVLERHLNLFKDFLSRDVALEKDPEKIFVSFAKFYISIFDQIRDFIPLLMREVISGGSQLKHILSDLDGNSPAMILKQAIEKGQADGLFREIDWRQSTISFVGMNLFYLMLFPVSNFVLEIDDKESFREKRAEAIADLFLNGLRKREK